MKIENSHEVTAWTETINQLNEFFKEIIWTSCIVYNDGRAKKKHNVNKKSEICKLSSLNMVINNKWK